MSATVLDGLGEQHCQCSGCGKGFSGTAPFDRHRVGKYAELGHFKGTRRCLTAAELAGRGWMKSAKGFWSPPRRTA